MNQQQQQRQQQQPEAEAYGNFINSINSDMVVMASMVNATIPGYRPCGGILLLGVICSQQRK